MHDQNEIPYRLIPFKFDRRNCMKMATTNGLLTQTGIIMKPININRRYNIAPKYFLVIFSSVMFVFYYCFKDMYVARMKNTINAYEILVRETSWKASIWSTKIWKNSLWKKIVMLRMWVHCNRFCVSCDELTDSTFN